MLTARFIVALVGAFNQEKALVGAFSVIVQPVVEPMEHYTALVLQQSGDNGEINTFFALLKKSFSA